MRAIGYVRVSTEEQGQDERFSLPHQKEHIRQECKSRGWELLNLFEDIESGKSTRKRGGFKSALKAMGSADILVVHELDRLSRNMIDTLIIVDDLNKSGKKFVSIHDNIDSSNEQGELQLHILAVFAHYFRKQLGRKVHGGMQTRAEQGLWNSKPPFGYKLVDKRLVENEDESWVVKKIFDLYVNGNLGYITIARQLNSVGLRTRKGALWSGNSIRHILVNQTYTGDAVWNKSKWIETIATKRPEEEWVVAENAHKDLIDKDLFVQAQERMKVKSRLGGRAQASNYLLSGLIKCGHCGSPMFGNNQVSRSGKPYYKYVCSGYQKNGKLICHHVWGLKEVVEEKVISLIKTEAGTKEEVNSIKFKPKINIAALTEERQRLKNELSISGQRFARQMEAFEAGIIDLSELKTAKERVTQQVEVIQNELDLLESKINSFDEREIVRRQISDVYDVFESADFQAQKAWLQQNLIKVVYLSKDNMEVHFRVSLTIQ